MALSGVDKFPLVAKILVDMRLQELLEENKKLREDKELLELRAFWSSHNIDWFKSLIQATLQTRVKCMCEACHAYNPSNGFGGRWECTLKLAFRNLAEEHGFSVMPEDSSDYYSYGQYFPYSVTDLEDRDDDWTYQFCSGDVHFVLTSSVADWVVLGYGQKLMQAKSIHDPEVVKLKQFFETLVRIKS